MAASTAHLSLTKPVVTDGTKIREDFNDNMDLIDSAFEDALAYDTSPVLRGNLDIGAFNIEGVDATEFGYLNGISSFGGTLIDDADAATARTTLGLVISINVAEAGANNDITSLTGLTTPLGAAYGGTGVANAAGETITINGGFALTLTLTEATGVTLPASGTLVNSAVATLSSLTSVGTITTGGLGTSATLGSVTVNIASSAENDIYYAGVSNVLSRLAAEAGATNKFLRSVSAGAPSWQTLATGDIPDISATYSPLAGSGSIVTIGTVTSGTLSTGAVLADVTMTLGGDADGDIYYRSSGKLTRLAKGTDGHYLKIGATNPEWAASGGGYTNLTSFVDQTAFRVFYSNTAGDITELALGANGTYLKSNGAAANPSFATPAGAGDVVKVGTPANSQVGVWTGDGTIEGAASFTYDGSNLQLTGDIGSTGTRITKGWFANLETTGDLTVNGTALASTYATLGANTNITSILNAGLYIGRDADNQIKFAADNNIVFRLAGSDGALFNANGELDMNANSIGFTQQTVTYNSATTTADWTNGNKAIMTFGAGNITTFAFTNPTNPCNLLLKIVQDGTGSRVVTAWDADIKWAGGSAPTLTTGANTIDVISFYFDGSVYYGVASLAFS